MEKVRSGEAWLREACLGEGLIGGSACGGRLFGEGLNGGGLNRKSLGLFGRKRLVLARRAECSRKSDVQPGPGEIRKSIPCDSMGTCRFV